MLYRSEKFPALWFDKKINIPNLSRLKQVKRFKKFCLHYFLRKNLKNWIFLGEVCYSNEVNYSGRTLKTTVLVYLNRKLRLRLTDRKMRSIEARNSWNSDDKKRNCNGADFYI